MIHAFIRRRDRGETLVEILIAIAVLGIAATGLISALSTGIFATDAHRRISSAESVLRAYGELVKNKILHPVGTTTTSDLGPYDAGTTLTVPVVSTAAFTDGFPYTISLDGSIIRVTSQTATSFTGNVLGGGSARSGAVVQRYESCPGTAFWNDVLASHTELTTSNVNDVEQVASVTFYDNNNNAVTCSTYHGDNGPTTCANTGNWRTECDPPWMRVSIQITRTLSGRSTAATATDVIIRRLS